MAVEFDIKTYFTPSNITRPAMAAVLGYYTGWKRPFELIYLNRTNTANKTPEAHQYTSGKRFENGFYAPVPYIEVTNHLYQGGYATIVWESKSDRDAFDLVPTEKWNIKSIVDITTGSPAVVTTNANYFEDGDTVYIQGVEGMEQLNGNPFTIHTLSSNTFQLIGSTTVGTVYLGGGTATDLDNDLAFPGGYQMPHIDFPYRAWEINMRGKDDVSYPSPVMFRGMRTRIRDITLGDQRLSGIQDAQYRFELELMSFDAWNLRHDGGAALWYHRKNKTTDRYHLAFDTSMHITFDQAITQIVAWMNQGRPTKDFPIEYSYTPKNTSPYNIYLDATVFTPPRTIVNTEQKATWDILTELLNVMGGIEAIGLEYIPTCGVSGVIDSILGGFDKTQPAYTDFRTHQDMQQDADTTLVLDFTRIHAKFTGDQTCEYRYAFVLQKWNADMGGWETNETIPPTGYEYVAYDPKNTHSSIDINFIKKDAGRYKWNLEVLSAKGISVDTSGSYAATAPAYTLQPSNSEVDITQIESFIQTRGFCDGIRQLDLDGYPTDSACPSLVTGLCPDQWGCYPDPITNTLSPLTGVLTFAANTISVSGVGTLFLSQLSPGDLIKPNVGSVFFQVLSITNNTLLTLSTPFIDPYFSGNLVGASSKSGAILSNETVNPTYGILSTQPYDYSNQSSVTNSWDTKCRLNSKREYMKSLNADSSVREPVNVHLEFADGWSEDLIGKYCEYYSPSANKTITFRVLSQTQIMQGRRLKTKIDGYRL